MGLHLLVIVLDGSHLPNYNLSFGAEKNQSVVETSDERLHFVFYSTSSVTFIRFVLCTEESTMKEAG